MRIQSEILGNMFKAAGVDKQKMYAALIQMGPKELKSHLRDEWSPENPTRNFCYVIAEFVYNFCAPAGSSVYSLVIPNDSAKHYYVVTPSGSLLDLAAEQFEDYSTVKYENGKKTHFQYPSPSRRARKLSELTL